MEKLLTTENSDACYNTGSSFIVRASAKGHTQLCKTLLEKWALVDKVSNVANLCFFFGVILTDTNC